jgi:hypothetical protein
VEDVAEGPVAHAAAEGRIRIRRSVVAYTGLEPQGPASAADGSDP